jgi:predicted nucleotidyltransferase
LYSDSKYFALVCSDKLFLKNTPKLLAQIGDDGLRAYPGSINTLHVPEELLESKKALAKVVRI